MRDVDPEVSGAVLVFLALIVCATVGMVKCQRIDREQLRDCIARTGKPIDCREAAR